MMNKDEIPDVVYASTLPVPPPRTIHQRIRLAVYWSLQGAVTRDDLPDNLPKNFLQQLEYVGLKLVWADGSPISGRTWADNVRRGNAARVKRQA
jgi:hypothetical protein